jgi:hypothetical protein
MEVCYDFNWNEIVWAGNCVYHDRPLNALTTKLFTIQANPVPYRKLVVII